MSSPSLLGLKPERSSPTSPMTSTTSGQMAFAGWDPADSARMSLGAWRSKNAWAICERPALWLQTNSTYFMDASSRGDQQLLGVLGGQPRRGDLARDRVGVVLHSLDASVDPRARVLEDRERAPGID